MKNERLKSISRNWHTRRRLTLAFEELHKAEGKTEHVFRNSQTGQPFRDVKKAFKSACEKAGIQNLRFDDLRHTFASRLVERGADLIAVKELLGHSTVKMTERYTYPNLAQKQKAVETLCRTVPRSPRTRLVCHIFVTQRRIVRSQRPQKIHYQLIRRQARFSPTCMAFKRSPVRSWSAPPPKEP
jgi:hypothetical protein